MMDVRTNRSRERACRQPCCRRWRTDLRWRMLQLWSPATKHTAFRTTGAFKQIISV